MTGPGRSRRGGRERALEASQRLYGALTRAYPPDVRERYGKEMADCFRDSCRDEVRRRGARGLAELWARTLPDLVFTAARERSTMLARNFAQNAYLPARPAVVKRWGGLSALLGGATGTAAYCFLGVYPYLPLLVVLLFSALLSTMGLLVLYGTLAAAAGRPGWLAAAGASLAAASAVSWLALGAFAALGMVRGGRPCQRGRPYRRVGRSRRPSVAGSPGSCCWPSPPTERGWRDACGLCP